MKIKIKKNTERIKNIIELKSTTCPKVTKFTDIFWKLAANLQKV
jgi:hypothetical protein